jgi:hypothetical protein
MGSPVQVTFTSDAIAGAILAGMNDDQKSALIGQALDRLFAPSKDDGYGRKSKSIIEEAVEDAVKRVAYDLVKDHVAKNPEIEGKIAEAIRTAVTEGCTSEKAIKALKDRVTAAVEGVFGSRYG